VVCGIAYDRSFCTWLGPESRETLQIYGPVTQEAKRLNELAKSLGEDILVDEKLALESEKYIIMQPVKQTVNKSQIYRVLGFVDSNHNTVEIHSPYSRFSSRSSG
ncbi:MAG: hypothetical protein KDD25_09630, partial [Bdellovibrionales bacterium]|nr:hypothetical protein [Bdellovibrionales bacterium]